MKINMQSSRGWMRLLLTCVVFLMLFEVISISAQDTTITERPKLASSIASNSITDIHWSHDGDTLIFKDQPINQDIQFYSLEVAQPSSELVPINSNDIQKTQTDSLILSQLKLAVDTSGTSQVISSPDGRFLVYVTSQSKTPENIGYFIALTNTVNQITVIVPEIIVDDLSDMNQSYRIDWSGDGSAFILRSHSGFGADNIYYVSDYIGNMTAIKTKKLESFEVQGQLIGVRTDFSALSNDGKSVILTGQIGVKEVNLFLWQVDNPASSRKLLTSTYTFTTANFAPDEQSIVFINRDGLQRLDMKSLNITMIDPMINSTWVSKAFFSPDKMKIALVEQSNSGVAETNFYIVEISS